LSYTPVLESPPTSYRHADFRLARGCREQAGTYTLYVLVEDPENWKLIINNQTGQNGDSYDPSMDRGRVDMEMEKPPVPIENLKYYDHH
jgi:hypothetical protein